MAYYLVQAAFTPAAAAALLKSPENRFEALRPAVENLGGGIQDGWLAFGEYHLVMVVQMPDNVSATAFSVAVSNGGTVNDIKITPLMTLHEGMEAARKASEAEAAESLPLPGMGEEAEMTTEQIQELLEPNLEYAAACVESAHQVIKELGIQETLPTVNTAITHGLHFLQLAQRYLDELRQLMRNSPDGESP